MNLFKHVRRVTLGAFQRERLGFFSTDSSPVPSPKPSAKRKSSYVSSSQQIYNSLQDSETFVANYDRMNPALFRNRSLPPTSWYCLSDRTADILFQAIKPHLTPEKTIIEMNPGLGIITKKLLSAVPSRLLAYEPDPHFREILSPLASKHRQLTIIPKQFLSIWKEELKQKIYGDDRLTSFLPGIKPAAWAADPTIQIIGNVPSTKFIQYFMSSVTYQQGMILYGRPELFFVTTPGIFVKMTYDTSSPYSALCVRKFSHLLLFRIYFDIEVLGEVDGKSFVPRFRHRKTSAKSIYAKHEVAASLVFVRALPKRDLLDMVPRNQLKSLWFFVTQAVLKSKFKVIPFLEKWIPGIGPMCIVKGLSVFTEFRDLTPAELLDVFMLFMNHPDYESCLFHEAVDSFVYKCESDTLGDSDDVEGQATLAGDNVHKSNVDHGSADKKAA